MLTKTGRGMGTRLMADIAGSTLPCAYRMNLPCCASTLPYDCSYIKRDVVHRLFIHVTLTIHMYWQLIVIIIVLIKVL